MLVCGALTLAFMLSILLSLEAGTVRIAAALGFAALAPLMLGSVVLSRFDLWPAALTVGALAAFVAGRDRLGSGVLGLAVSAKIFPAVLVPVAAAWVWRRSGRREGLVCLGVLAAVVLACFLPFVVLTAFACAPKTAPETTLSNTIDEDVPDDQYTPPGLTDGALWTNGLEYFGPNASHRSA